MLTSFIGTTWEQRMAFHDQEFAEAKKLRDIADRYDVRIETRREHIDRLEAEIKRLEAKNSRERQIWHDAMTKSTAHYTRIIAMWDELDAAKTQASA